MFMREVKEERVLGGEKIALKNKGRGTKQIKLKKIILISLFMKSRD